MNIFNLTFPLTIDFSGGKYWINGGALTSAGKR
jgi:hypothetical protein